MDDVRHGGRNKRTLEGATKKREITKNRRRDTKIIKKTGVEENGDGR
jgi:hypothetical protein